VTDISLDAFDAAVDAVDTPKAIVIAGQGDPADIIAMAIAEFYLFNFSLIDDGQADEAAAAILERLARAGWALVPVATAVRLDGRTDRSAA
jgi:hypothetical protein